MHPLTARHPRYTIALIVFFFVAVLYYANAGSSSTAMHPLRNPSRPPSLTKVNDVIRLHEGYYKQHLKNRKKLIEKFGPTVDEVESYVHSR